MALLCGPNRCRVLLTLLASLLLFGARAANGERDIQDFCRVAEGLGDAWAPCTGGGTLHCPSCQQFVYGGCGRNGSDCLTREESLQKCADTPGSTMDDAATSRSPADSSGPSVPRRQGFDGPSSDISNCEGYCAANMTAGPCHASCPRWHVDANSNSWDRFTYGGRWGDRNSCLSEKACMSRCLGRRSYPALPGNTATFTDKVLLAILIIQPYFLLLSLFIMWHMKEKFGLTFCSSRDDGAPLLRKRTWRRAG